jgi:uncharacterized SAM-binding protein YcdF (DUF218 family)
MPGAYYDAVIILGSQQDVITGEVPHHVLQSIDEAVSVLKAGKTPAIAVSGRWALFFDVKNIGPPPITECALLTKHLIEKGVNMQSIWQENESKDTVANIYFLKQKLLEPKHAKRLLFIIADFRKERLVYLTRKILGHDYKVAFKTIPSQSEERYPHEQDTMARTEYYFDAMQPGDDSYVEGMFYDHPFYTASWPIE